MERGEDTSVGSIHFCEISFACESLSTYLKHFDLMFLMGQNREVNKVARVRMQQNNKLFCNGDILIKIPIRALTSVNAPKCSALCVIYRLGMGKGNAPPNRCQCIC